MMTENHPDPKKRKAICELCGGHSRDLSILVQAEFIGWACEECRQQLMACQVRRFCSAGEVTEPEE